MQKLFDATGMSFSTITSLEKEDLIKVAELSEPNPLAQILLRGNLLSIKSQLSPTSNSIPAEVNNDPVETEANSQSQVTTSTDSTFGSVVFPSKTDKVRDTNRWPLVLGRRYKGTSDPIPISAFCNQLISIGIREAASNVEFFRFVLGNLETSINVEVVNFLISKGIMEESKAAVRLPALFEFLKSRFALTDNSVILQSRLEKLKQNGRTIAEFSEIFHQRLEELKMSQSGNPLTEAYILSAFKNSLDDSYRLFADDQCSVRTCSQMVELLIVWEQNIEARESRLTSSSKIPSKSKAHLAQSRKCSFCERGFHSEDKCWKKHPELMPPMCTKCNRHHLGSCKSSSSSNDNISPNANLKFDSKTEDRILKTSIATISDGTCQVVRPFKPWTLELTHYGCSALIDSGASSSMISVKQGLHFLNNFENDTELFELNSPMTIEFGDANKVQATQYITVNHVIGDVSVDFIVVPKLSVPLLIGLSDFDSLKLLQQRCEACQCTDPTPEVISSTAPNDIDLQFYRNVDGTITVTSPLFENAHILPWREKARSRSELELSIMDDLIRGMLAEGKVRKASSNELLIVQELILVDKFLSKGVHKPKAYPPEDGRYRLVLDCRPANALRLDKSTNSWVVDQMLFGGNQPSQTNETCQSQHSALSQLESISHSERKYFAKVDLKNAFYSTKVTTKLSQIFGFRHRGEYYSFMVLPMGWFLSPSIFQDVVSFMIDSAADKLENVRVIHQQDDILIVGPSFSHVEKAMEILIDTFKSFNFAVRPEKCEGPAESASFCGLKIFSDGGIKPYPIKRQLNEIAARTAAEAFDRVKTVADTKHILRSWLGTSAYFSKWLPADLRDESLVLHSFLPKLDTGEVSRQDLVERAATFVKGLCKWWIENPISLYGGSSNCEDTLVIVDANVTGWSGCIFRLAEVEKGTNYPLPFSLSGLLSTHEKILIPEGKSVDEYTLLPVRFDGARFGSKFETQQSSTWRERAAAMLMVHRNKDVLSRRVFILSDNKNLVGSWKDTEILNSSLCTAFTTYISHVYGAIHVKRNHPVLMWVDQCARNIESNTPGQISDIIALPARIEELDLTSPRATDTKRPRVDDGFSQSDNDEVLMSPEDFAVDQVVKNYSGPEVNPLLERGWIVPEGNNFYTTEKFPGNIVVHSLLIPTDQGPDILRSIHYDYGHATIAGIRKYLSLWRIWVGNFDKIAKDIISDCKFCLHCRDTFHPERSTIPMPKRPMDLIMADFLQPEKISQPAFLVFRDRYSGYTEGRAIEKMDQYEAKQLLIEWIARFGPPSIFKTDNAEAFNSDLMNCLYAKYHIRHINSPVYEPKSNGSVERIIKSVEEGLRIELMAGTPAQEAIHIVTGRLNRTTLVPGDSNISSPRETIFKFFEESPFFHTFPVGNFKHDLEIGQRVLVKIPNAPKLSPQFGEIPYTISEIIGNHIYRLTDDQGFPVKSSVRRDGLKPLFMDYDGDNASICSIVEGGMCE